MNGNWKLNHFIKILTITDLCVWRVEFNGIGETPASLGSILFDEVSWWGFFCKLFPWELICFWTNWFLLSLVELWFKSWLWWNLLLDGPNPATNTQTLINTATRCVKVLTGIDLTACSQWTKKTKIKIT